MINGIDVNIPCGLSRDLCAALKYAESKNKGSIKEEDNLFEYLYKYKGKFGWKVLIHGFIILRKILG